jgi:hypothetical protein
MNAEDLARLELAKRAYRSTEPRASEVQRGVRKARLGLQRPRLRSTWLTKTVVACVLAMGGLAYAKPQALGELVQTALRSTPSGSKHEGASGLAPAPAALVPPRKAPATQPAQSPRANATPVAAAPVAAPQVVEPARVAPVVAAAKAVNAPRAAQPTEVPVVLAEEAPLARNASTPSGKRAASAGSFPDASASKGAQSPQQVTDWGRVGSALAKGDETQALAVLNELSESEDRRTRDKADLGRAQLMMSNGNRDKACATARSLTNRGAGSRIERQAQVLLKGCNR